MDPVEVNRRGHLVARSLAVVPILAAAFFVLSPMPLPGFAREPKIASEGTTGSVPIMAAKTVPAMLSDVDVEELPELFAREIPGTMPLGDNEIQPKLIGIAGRLPDDVEVMLRMSDGQIRSIGLGENAGEWRLVSAQADLAVFSAGGRQIILTLGPLP